MWQLISAKQKKWLETVYICISVLFTGVFIFEVPKAVFYSPLLLFVAFIVYSLYAGRELKTSASMLVLLIFTISYVYFIYTPESGLYYQAYIHIHALCMYIIGYNFLNDKPQEERKKAIETYFLIISVLYLAYIGVTLYHYFYMTEADLKFRFYYSIWYRSVTKPSTVISMCLVFPLAYGLYSLFYLRWQYKIVGAVFVFFTLFINIKTATRTLIYIFPVVLCAEFIFWLSYEKKKKKAGKIIFAALVAAALAAVVLLVRYKDFLTERFAGYGFARIFNPGGNSTRLRILYSLNVLKDFSLTYLGGGEHSLTFGTPHNIWLYIYDWGGIVSLAIFCVFTVMLIVSYVRFFKDKRYTVAFKALLSTALFLIFVEFMMEPFILPLPSFYILCYFVMGLVSGFSSRENARISATPNAARDGEPSGKTLKINFLKKLLKK